jgi:hypothetical protein
MVRTSLIASFSVLSMSASTQFCVSKNEKASEEKKQAEAKADTCALSKGMCTMEYDPATCTLSRNKEKKEASGNNSCAARQALFSFYCSTGESLTSLEAESVTCVKAEPK